MKPNLWIRSMARRAAAGALAVAVAAHAASPARLAWDQTIQSTKVKAGTTNHRFVFRMTNGTPNEILISRINTSCGCTVARPPKMPWSIPAGTGAELPVEINLVNRHGRIAKSVVVQSSAGPQTLRVVVEKPKAPPSPVPILTPSGADPNTPMERRDAATRMRNLATALADRQAVFKGACVECHVKPGVGKKGKPLYAAVCGVCHDGEHRNAMVPDLAKLNKPTDAAYWRQWIVEGKAGTLMPAFARKHKGPLSDEQIQSLVDYLVVRPAASTSGKAR